MHCIIKQGPHYCFGMGSGEYLLYYISSLYIDRRLIIIIENKLKTKLFQFFHIDLR